MSSSTKGLKRRGNDGRWRETIEGWTVDYRRSYTWDGLGWEAHIDGKRSRLSKVYASTLRAARAAARAVVMERETRGLTPKSPEGLFADKWFDDSIKAEFDCSTIHGWDWDIDFGDGGSGTAHTLAEARKAAREAT
jgi:hypothetical protein